MRTPIFNSLMFKLSFLTVALGLTACQSIQSTQNTKAHQSLDASQAFAIYQKTDDANAKTAIVKALQAHLEKDRTAVSTYYYQATPKDDANSLNAGADPLWLSVMKLWDFEEEEEALDGAYRRVGDYATLGDDSARYLRYYDEKDGTEPVADYALSRLDGLDDTYYHTAEHIAELKDDYQGCIQKSSYDLDRLVKANPAIHHKDKQVVAIEREIASCIRQADEYNLYAEERANDYQKQDVALLRQCVSSYQKDLQAALSSTRTQRRYDGEHYDSYESVYAHYSLCNVIYETSRQQDPAYYMDEEYTERRLDLLKGVRQCAATTTKNHDDLLMLGKTYATDPKEFEQNVYGYFSCIGEVKNELFDEQVAIITPTSMREAEEYYYLWREQISADTFAWELEEESYVDKIGERSGRFFRMKQAELDKKAEEQAGNAQKDEPVYFGDKFSKILDAMKKTPEQLTAQNYYTYNNTTVSVISQNNPVARTYGGVMAIEFESPTAIQSLALPVWADFNKGVLRADVSGVLPITALLGGEYALSKKDFEKAGAKVGVAEFRLPEELDGLIPMSVIYDSVQKGLLVGMSELNATNFSRVQLANDEFGRQLGASSVIKLNLSTREMGELTAFISKQLIKDLSAYVDENPQIFEKELESSDVVAEDIKSQKAHERAKSVKSFIEKWVLLDKGFVSSDIGGVMQIIEGVLPIDFYTINYYYLDKEGRLVGQVLKSDEDELIGNSRTQMLAITSFNTKDFNAHPLKAKLVDASGKALDGNALIKTLKETYELKKEAALLRSEYDDELAVKEAAKAAEE